MLFALRWKHSFWLQVMGGGNASSLWAKFEYLELGFPLVVEANVHIQSYCE